MRCLGLNAVAVSVLLAMSCVLPAVAADSSATPNTPARMEITDDGPILVTPSGATLYTFGADDSRPGTSQCTNVPVRGMKDVTGGLGMYPYPHADSQKGCAQEWLPYIVDASAATVGDWSVITRSDGGKQWAFRGHPLYTSVKDHKAGDRNGATGFGGGGGGRGFRFATVPLDLPSGLKLTRREEGLILATADNRPVYTPHGARISKACSGCDDEFQPILASALAEVSGDWSIINAGAGRRQYAFKGQSLYSAPASMSDGEIANAGGWQAVVFRKSPGAPPEIEKRFTLLGDVYTDKTGKTLYTFNCNAGGVSCNNPGDPAQYWVKLCGVAEECARRWHPYIASANARSVGEWSVVDVSYPIFTDPVGFTYPPETPRVKAWAYRGEPVYTYYEDKKAGDIWGNEIRNFVGVSFLALQVPGHSAVD